MKSSRYSLSLVRSFLALGSFGLIPALAQVADSGMVEGRVLNTRSGEYLEKARLTIEGTSLEVFTDSSGHYRFASVPTGTVRVRVFFTGLDLHVESVLVSAGAIVTVDFNLVAMQRSPATAKDSGMVKMSAYVVGASKEMDGAAIAINQQRFARNVVNVVSADEFGTVAEGNVGEFLKFLPGMSVDYVGGDALTISMGGVPANYVPVTINGFNVASAASSSTTRNVEISQFSINNLARVEVYHSPTPESPGSALAGGVNLIPRSAFERSRPSFNASAFVMMRDAERSLQKTPGPLNEPTHKIHPGMDFSWVVPVNKRFGFTLSGSSSSQYSMEDAMTNMWRGAGNATSAPAANGTPGAWPDTTPDKPYLTNSWVTDSTKITSRASVGATADFKLTRNDVLSVSFQYAYFSARFNGRTLQFNITGVNPGDFTPTSTNGAPAQGNITLVNAARHKSGTTTMPTLVWRHDGPIWKAEAGAGTSHASNHYRDVDKGYFNGANAQRIGVTVAFDQIFYLRPKVITVKGGAGAPVDPYRLDSYVLNTANSNFRESSDLERSANANLGRTLNVRGMEIAVKIGGEISESMRDIRGGMVPYTFIGRDHIASSSDDGAGIVLDEVFSQRYAPWGFPKVQYVSNYKYWNLYQAHPDYFTIDQNLAYRNAVNLSKRAAEVISSAFIRGDVALFERRLKLVGGVRVEQTNTKAEGPLTDPTRDFQRDSSGNVLRAANGTPLLIVPTTAGLPYTQLTLVDRGYHAKKEYLRVFPSINASFNVGENLIARASWYTSVGRPDFNQYAGGLTLPDTELAPNSASNLIMVNNAGIKAWSARTAKVRVEYYFERVGQVSMGAFRRDFRNLFGSITIDATPEFLAHYSLDSETYDRFAVQTNHNISTPVRMTGLEFDYKQSLTFLPAWARGVQVFANATAIRATGDESNSFSGYAPRTYNWGVSLSRPNYNLRMNWNYKGRKRGARIAASPRSIEPGTYDWSSKRLYIDLSGEYTVFKRVALFANLRNIGDATEDTERAGPNTPPIAQLRFRQDFGSLWTFGIKGSF